MEFTNSSLATVKVLSPNHSGKRTQDIDTITIHMVWGQCTAQAIGDIFLPESRHASSNYGVGKDGDIGLYVEEQNRSWCSSSSENDNRAITIEVANDRTGVMAVNDKAYESLIKLCIDICKRNGKKKLIWVDSLTKANTRKYADDEMRMTVHRWFSKTNCPGEWLMNHMSEIADRVTNELNTTPAPSFRNLRKGCKGEDVKELQTKLNKVMNYSLVVDGDFGEKTNAAVRSFQKKYGLVVDGIYGKNSEAKMKEVMSEPVKTFSVRVDIPNLNIRKGPGTSYNVVGKCPKGIFTIVETKIAEGLEWGKLKSGAGWIALKYTVKL